MGGESRRLATILAIDIAGFSRASERDEIAAARAVSGLRERCAAAAAERHGRIFNTAGDGVMLEFPTVADGVAGALDIAEGAAEAHKEGLPPIRLGLHVGDVTVMANGDLIGAGVNVAARVQQRAEPGEVLTTGDVKNLFATQSAAQFTRYGGAQLDKMARQVDLFALARPGVKVRKTLMQRLRHDRYRLAQAGIAALLAITMTAVLFMIFPPSKSAARRIAEAPRQPVVAVLPIENLSGDASLDYFSAGMTGEMRHALSRIQGIRVVSRGADFAGGDADGTTHVLSGSVRKNGDQLRISAELTRASGEVLWNDSYQRPLSETLAVQDEIAGRVARALSVVAPESARSASIDPRAFELYLRGRDRWRTGGEDSMVPQSAIADLEEATRIAPDFARAWVALASAYAQKQNWFVGAEQDALIEKARGAARKALELDERLGEAYLVLGRFDPSPDWNVRSELFARAIAAEPNDPDVLMLHADFWLAETGATGEARREIARAYEADPNSDLIVSRYLDILSATNDTAAIEKVVAAAGPDTPMYSAYWQMVMTNRMHAGDFAGARAALDKVLAYFERLKNKIPEEKLAEARDMLTRLLRAKETGDQAELEKLADEFMADTASGQAGALTAMFNLEMLGFHDKARGVAEELYLNNGYRPEDTARLTHVPGVYAIGRVPLAGLMSYQMRAFRTDPLTWRIFAAKGLAAYWQASDRWPDFCDEIGPDVCKAEAEKALAAEKMN